MLASKAARSTPTAELGPLLEAVEELADGGTSSFLDPIFLCFAGNGLAEDAAFLMTAGSAVLIGPDRPKITVLEAEENDRLIIAGTARGLLDLPLETAAAEALRSSFD